MTKKTDITTPELWDFPMDYPISIIGEAGDQLLIDVKMIFTKYVPDFDLATIQVRPSKTGKYHSIKARLYVTDAQQINGMYADFDAAPSVKTVL